MTQEEALELFEYDRDTGKLYWKVDRYSNKVKGKEVGNIDGHGYRRFMYKRKKYRVHRVIWLMEYGYMPKAIDHINRNRLDNRLENLREVSKKDNAKNMSLNSKNKFGISGISKTKTGKYRSYITVNYKQISLGYYKNINDAISARINALKKYGFEITHGIGQQLQRVKNDAQGKAIEVR